MTTIPHRLSRFSILADPRLVVGWLVAVLLIGTVLRADVGWTAFVAILPAALVGFQTVLRGQASTTVSPMKSTVAAPAEQEREALPSRIPEISRELDRAANALLALSVQSTGTNEQAAVI